MQPKLTRQDTSSWGLALLTAIHVALSLALMALFLLSCGCTVSEGPPPDVRHRRVNVDVRIDLNKRPPCPDNRCPYKQSSCDCGCSGDVCPCADCESNFGLSTLDFRLRRQPGHRLGSAPATAHVLHVSPERPVMNLPMEARCRNYGGGSCVCASTISLLRWQGRDDLAQGLRANCGGGQSAGSLHAHLERLGVRYAYTTSGDVSFLEWAVRTRRGCGITFYPAHFVNLVDLTADEATLLDNNRVGQYITLPRDEFVRRWRGYGGWATAVVYSPAAPVAR
jgi:hypothetical protein